MFFEHRLAKGGEESVQKMIYGKQSAVKFTSVRF